MYTDKSTIYFQQWKTILRGKIEKSFLHKLTDYSIQGVRIFKLIRKTCVIRTMQSKQNKYFDSQCVMSVLF